MASKRTIVTALNIMDGLAISGDTERYDVVKAAYESRGFGFIEFTGWLADAADMLEKVYDEACLAEKHPDHGVFDYEVSYFVGQKIFEEAEEMAVLPDQSRLREICVESVRAFFAGQAVKVTPM